MEPIGEGFGWEQRRDVLHIVDCWGVGPPKLKVHQQILVNNPAKRIDKLSKILSFGSAGLIER